MKIFRKEYFHNWKMHLFLAVQIIFIFALLNLQVSSIMEKYKRLSFAEEYGENIYIYENSMACLMEDDVSRQNFLEASEILNGMDGVEDVGYQAMLECDVDGLEGADITSYYISPLVKNSVRYRLWEGSWFGEENTDEMEIIIGGDLSKQYHVGDVMELVFEGRVKKTARVIGDLGNSPYILNFDAMGAVQTFLNFTEKDKNIILTDDDTLIDEMEYASYPFMSVLVKLEENADLSKYETYGHMISFHQLAENTRQELREFIYNCISRNAVWILVVIFGVAGTSYLSAQKNRYTWGVYSLMGMTGGTMMRSMMIQNMITYAAGTIISIGIYPYLKQQLSYSGEWTDSNFYATAILFFILIVVSYLCNRYIYFIEPKEILQQAKE